MFVRGLEDNDEKDRKEHTLLGSLIAQNISRKVTSPEESPQICGSSANTSLLANQRLYDGDSYRRQGKQEIFLQMASLVGYCR